MAGSPIGGPTLGATGGPNLLISQSVSLYQTACFRMAARSFSGVEIGRRLYFWASS